MTKNELQIELKAIGVSENDYSINEGLKPDAHIIDKHGTKWNLFYYDEKGEHSDYKVFEKEDEAYSYLLNLFKEDLKLLGKDKFNSDG